jgi:hypothetical protein
MYTLYFNRSRKEIELKKARKAFQNLNYTEEAVKYNDCIYICAKRKPLVDKAKEIQQNWVLQLEEELKVINEIKI